MEEFKKREKERFFASCLKSAFLMIEKNSPTNIFAGRVWS
jgi:hypothetical protein